MHGKMYRFIFIEMRFKAYFFGLLAIVIFSVVEIGAIGFVNAKIAEGNARKELIVRIPEMESVLYPGTIRQTMIKETKAEPITIGGTLYILKGTQNVDGKLFALINNDVYQEGDTVNGYEITRITVASVLFKHQTTDEMKILRLGN